MRLVAFGLALALAAIPAAARAQAPLAPGEVLLELGSIGARTVPADLATMNVGVGGSGETEAAARADLDARYRRVIAAARQAGVPAAAISEGEPSHIADLRTFDVMEEPPPPMEEPPSPPGSAPVDARAAAPSRPRPPTHYASRSAIVRVTDMARVGAIRAALAAAAESEPGSAMAVYSLTDSRAARQAARAQALAAIRADAEAYAASLGMRVARIVRVTERTGVGLLPQLALGEAATMRQFFGPGQGREPNITVFAVVGVDFALAPR